MVGDLCIHHNNINFKIGDAYETIIRTNPADVSFSFIRNHLISSLHVASHKIREHVLLKKKSLRNFSKS